LCKIDYIHTRFSVLVNDVLSANSFVHTVLKKISKGESYNAPQNDQLFDIIPLEECARAYYLIGNNGVNKADYYIGSGDPKTLSQYFDQFEKVVSGLDYNIETPLHSNNHVLGPESFSVSDLKSEIGFTLDISFEDFIKKIAK
jgi:nucleoside-diphosphate-sugar epimerase